MLDTVALQAFLGDEQTCIFVTLLLYYTYLTLKGF